MWALFGWSESSSGLSTVTVACFNWESAAWLRSQRSAEVLLVSSLLFLDESSVFVKYLHKDKLSKDVHNIQITQTINLH